MRRTLIVCAFAGLLGGVAHAESTKASTEAEIDGTAQKAGNAFDGLLSTVWAGGEEVGSGGSWVEFSGDRAADVVSVSIWPGNLSQGLRSLKEYDRPRTITLSIRGSGPPVQRVDIPIRGRARAVHVRVDDVYEGLVHAGTVCISEIALNFAEGEPNPSVGKVYAWVEGDEGQRQRDAHAEEVSEWKAAAKGEDEEAASEGLAQLMAAAGEGPPYVQKWVAKYVPRGFRINALRPSQPAIEALLELRDPNSIPALEQAAARSKGHDERRLLQVVEMFYAYQELIGGPQANVPNWGQSGWSPGELRGFGEPVPLVVDQIGQIYVADTGNSRVQRFNDTGRVTASWGSEEADITNVWIGDKRVWYVSGAAPDAESGFINPVALALLPDKFEDGVAVLDAAGTVRVFDGQGAMQSSFVVPISNIPLLTGVGGQAYLELVKGRLVVLWADQAYIYDLEGEEQNRWNINDGAPSGSVVLKGGKLRLIHGSELVMHSIDGFRHGAVLGDTLGEGYEAWDVATDQDQRLWAVTDTGWAVKYKKPGKVDYRVRLDADGFIQPRIVVRDDVVYVSHGGRITVYDALELHEKDLIAEGAE
jgi:hypothetical protein